MAVLPYSAVKLRTEAPTVAVPAATCPLPLGNVVIGDYSAKNIRRVFGGDADDDGTPIAWEVLAHPAHGASAQTNAYYRRLIIKATDVTAGQTVNGTIWVGPVVQSPPRNVGRVATVPVAVALGMSSFDFNSEVDLTMDIGMIGTNARAALSGTGKIRIRGLEWHLVAKPLGRPTVFA